MNHIVGLLAVVLTLTAWGEVAQAQQPAKAPRLGFLFFGSRDQPHLQSFHHGLRELGYIKGNNILVEYRYPGTNPDRVSGFVEELIKLNVDVLVSSSAGAIGEAKKATKTIPIVMVASFDPVEKGIIDSFARPEETSQDSPDLPMS